MNYLFFITSGHDYPYNLHKLKKCVNNSKHNCTKDKYKKKKKKAFKTANKKVNVFAYTV